MKLFAALQLIAIATLLVAMKTVREELPAPNGWGLYVHFVPWIEAYLNACKAHPDADVSVSR
jgi:hypothetical protein